ncbi:MAG: ankyrin repeat domain-containing protein [Proteobacteria bacterium]|nr:ankyrin repeat domain-containing protein [Pseudomonadota bacterium]
MNQPGPHVGAPRLPAAKPRRFYVVGPDIAPVGYDMLEVALNVARQYGEGTDIVDTQATPYHPMVRRIVKGEPVYLEFGAWPTQAAPDQNLIEAAKKGCPAIVAAFLALGMDVNTRDSRGGTALIWAIARREPQCVRLLITAGADVNASDREGMSALKLAREKSLANIAEMLRAAGAIDETGAA